VKRCFLALVATFVFLLLAAAPAPADDSTTTVTAPDDATTTADVTTTTADVTTTVTAGIRITVDATDVGTYQLSLLGSQLDFKVTALGQTVQSQDPLTVVNNGTAQFDIYIGADSAPASTSGDRLSFSDPPGKDQISWSLASVADEAQGAPVSDGPATDFGILAPGRSLTLYSYLRLGDGLEHPGIYRWTATVYAVPVS
jgi:hypothetical protein